MNWIYVFLGGGIGSVSRYGLGLIFRESKLLLPMGTLVANLTAALIIGLLYYSGMKQRQDSIWLLLATGFGGGLSTFSAFSLETFELFRNGETAIAIMNIALSFVCCLMLVWVGSLVMK